MNLDILAYEGNDLGATWAQASTRFKLWTPLAEAVELILAPPGRGDEGFDAAQTIPMVPGADGVWTATVDGDLNHYRYLYAVTIGDGRNTLVDPYAKAVGVNGRTGVVLNLAETNPKGWVPGGLRTLPESPLDAVLYETHVRDLSIHPSSGISAKNAGKFLGFTEHGARTPDG
ncbi:MAG: type I pullulanase, partial [Defluviitaleaceae bacterium]|nr:type I pullulanase [Defluviitaleaceae bacterium]